MDYKEDIHRALDILRKGGIILYPTDTIWGIGCDATNPKAVDAIYRLKRRNESHSMLVLVESTERLSDFCAEVPVVAEQLSELSERPCTLVLDHAINLAPNLIASDGSIGIRVTRDSYSRELCQRLRRPIVSTSANISGQPSPAFFSQISEEIINGVDYVAEWRRNDETDVQPSSIIKIASDGQFKILRQ